MAPIRPTELSPAVEVERTRNPSELIDQFVARSIPVVVEGGMRSWAAPDLWTPEYLGRVMGETPVRVGVSKDDGVFHLTGNKALGFDHVPARQYIGETFGPSPSKLRYLLQLDLRSHFPALLRDLEEPSPSRAAGGASAINLWIGGRGNVSPLHYDPEPNLLCQVRGRKRLVLFAPQDLPNLYANSPWSRAPHLSRVAIHRPDFARYPRLKKARPFEAIIGPGEMLHIPVGWWHQVHTLETSISVNFWWPTSRAQSFSRSSLRLLPFDALRWAERWGAAALRAVRPLRGASSPPGS